MTFIISVVVLWLTVGFSYTLGTYDSSTESYRQVIRDNTVKSVLLSPVAVLKSVYDLIRNKIK